MAYRPIFPPDFISASLQNDVTVAFARSAHGGGLVGDGHLDPDQPLALLVVADGPERERGGDRVERGGADGEADYWMLHKGRSRRAPSGEANGPLTTRCEKEAVASPHRSPNPLPSRRGEDLRAQSALTRIAFASFLPRAKALIQR